MRPRVPTLAAIAAALAVTAVAAPGAGAATAEVQVRDFLFRPAFTQIAPGDEVRWVQGGSTTHTVTARANAPERFDSALLPGQTFARTFPVAGRYAYHCTIHPEMRGVVQVGPDTTAPKPTRLALRSRSRAVRVSFRLPEDAKVSLRVARASKPGRAVRQTKPRQLSEGARSLTVATAGLAPGRYRVDVRAVDRAANAASARAGGFAVAP